MEICSNNYMANDKDQTDKKNDETMTSTRERAQEKSASTTRPNIDVITQRNEDEAREDRKLSYIRAGLIALLAAVIIIAIYFFS